MEFLGKLIRSQMQAELAEHRVTGQLASSVRFEYDEGVQELAVGPTRKYGRWDAGAILELGTRPIPRAPWAPIRVWSNFRGLPAFPVWHKIRTRGVAAHPFLDRTLQASEGYIEGAAQRIADAMAVTIVLRGETAK